MTTAWQHEKYPSEGFKGVGSVNERPVRCLSPEVQVLVHAGYELTRKDYRELYLLREPVRSRATTGGPRTSDSRCPRRGRGVRAPPE